MEALEVTQMVDDNEFVEVELTEMERGKERDEVGQEIELGLGVVLPDKELDRVPETQRVGLTVGVEEVEKVDDIHSLALKE
jgi:hypothetical protein